MSFAQTFENVPDKGFAASLQRVKQGKAVCKGFLATLRERINMENNISKELHMLTKLTVIDNEYGPLNDTFVQMNKYYIVSSQAHAQLANKLNSDVIEPLENFLKQVTKVRKEKEADMAKSNKKMDNARLLRDDAQKKLLSKRQEELSANEQVESARSANLDEKQLKKAVEKDEKAKSALKDAERALEDEDQRVKNMTTAWEADVTQFCQACEKMESDRIQIMRELLEKRTELILNVYQQHLDANNNMKSVIAECTPENVNRAFLTAAASVKSRTPSQRVPSVPVPIVSPMVPSSTVLFKAKALYAYTAQTDQELSFPEGAQVSITSKDDATWWQGDFQGKHGYVPASYVEAQQ